MFWWFIDSLKHFKEYDDFFSCVLLPLGNFKVHSEKEGLTKRNTSSCWSHKKFCLEAWQGELTEKLTYLDSPISLIKSPSWVHIPLNTHCKMLHVGICWKKSILDTWSGCQYIAIICYLLALQCTCLRLHLDSTNQHLLRKNLIYKSDNSMNWGNCSTSLLNTPLFLSYTISPTSITCLWSNILSLV